MRKTLKSILSIIFYTVVGLIFLWGLIGIFYAVPQMNKIKAEYAQTKPIYKNRPVPDEISFLPNVQKTKTERIEYRYSDDERRARAAEYRLKINKRDGVYYWDSNGGKPLTVVTETKHDPYIGRPRWSTTFTAQDGSGSIVIFHDTYTTKGWCRDGSYHAIYREERLNEQRVFRGSSRFFPPRPDDWCKTLNDTLWEKGYYWYVYLQTPAHVVMQQSRN